MNIAIQLHFTSDKKMVHPAKMALTFPALYLTLFLSLFNYKTAKLIWMFYRINYRIKYGPWEQKKKNGMKRFNITSKPSEERAYSAEIFAWLTWLYGCKNESNL